MENQRAFKWALVICAVALLWFLAAAWAHAAAEKEGGLEAHLSERGCLGGGDGAAPSDLECSQAESEYERW
ncbi:MAG TPA: hypothetical protein VFX15_11300, partial [Actinomycetes bacterium]|nr:hypothetical protein [Actinomycetes bacterium]